jgi:hypothetical protein
LISFYGAHFANLPRALGEALREYADSSWFAMQAMQQRRLGVLNTKPEPWLMRFDFLRRVPRSHGNLSKRSMIF